MKDHTTYELIDNEEEKGYEFHIDGHKTILEYIKVKDKIYLTHTEVSKAPGRPGCHFSVGFASTHFNR